MPTSIMFQRLSTKLTVLYAGLFGVALFAVALTVYLAISDNAAHTVRRELQANGAVFDRVWALREGQLSDSAGILARDFGFRDAVATMDAPTIRSALDNLRQRLDIDRAFIMSIDGQLIGLDGVSEADADLLWNALDASGTASGVLTLNGHPFQAVSAPIRAPNLIGWVVFASELSAEHLRSLEALAAIPLKATVFTRTPSGKWRASNEQLSGDAPAITALLNRGAASNAAPKSVRVGGADAIALVKHLRSFDGQETSTLLLHYPLALAMAGFRPLLASIILIGIVSIALIVAGSWALARGLTRPIAALDAAARSLQSGDRTEVVVETSDEIGRLAHSFNVMSGEIASRERRITHMALHDTDTGLPNRRALENRLDDGNCGFVLALTILRYRQIRDAIGFELAAKVVQALAQKARGEHPELSCGRLAPDTLALVLPNCDEASALRLATEARNALDGPISVGGVQVDVSLVAGVAHKHDTGHTVLDRAMIASEQARRAQKPAALFDAAAYGDPARNLSLMSEMIDGINRGHLSLHYQPKLDLRSNKIAGVEALVRWNHPARGKIAPDEFIAMAEETGHIAELTEWTLIQAIGDQKRLSAAGLDLLVSVNLSGRLIGDDDFTAMAISLIADTAAQICLEITETAAMSEPEAALRNIDRYASEGVHISIDDYGAGYSSLTYLKRIRAYELKLDKSFIHALGENSREALLVKSTIDLAHSLGMKITAEGVETEPALALLAAMGCDIAQGYHIGKPMPVEELVATLRPKTNARLA